MKIILGDIIVRYMSEEKKEIIWELQREVSVQLSNKRFLEIPKGFVTDFASVPKIFWSAIAPIGHYNLASLIHDYHYTYHTTTRKFADKEFLMWLNFLTPKKKIRNKIMYIAIRLFGSKRWAYYGNGI
jgi:hypothetical protein